MKPPICVICGRDSSGPDADLIVFTKTEEDRAWARRAREEGLTGQPPWAEWFCRTHLSRAIILARDGLTLAEAVEEMRKPTWIGFLKALLGRPDQTTPTPRGRAALSHSRQRSRAAEGGNDPDDRDADGERPADESRPGDGVPPPGGPRGAAAGPDAAPSGGADGAADPPPAVTPGHDCRTAIEEAAPDLRISGRARGDVVTDHWYRCPECGLWSWKSVRDSPATGERASWRGPFSDEVTEARRALVAQCPAPSDDRCRCGAHRAYFGPD